MMAAGLPTMMAAVHHMHRLHAPLFFRQSHGLMTRAGNVIVMWHEPLSDGRSGPIKSSMKWRSKLPSKRLIRSLTTFKPSYSPKYGPTPWPLEGPSALPSKRPS